MEENLNKPKQEIKLKIKPKPEATQTTVERQENERFVIPEPAQGEKDTVSTQSLSLKGKRIEDYDVVGNGKGKDHISDTVKLQLKPKTSSSSAFESLEEIQESTPEEAEDNKVPLSSPELARPISNMPLKLPNSKAKRIYFIAILILAGVLIYFLITAIKILMAI